MLHEKEVKFLRDVAIPKLKDMKDDTQECIRMLELARTQLKREIVKIISK